MISNRFSVWKCALIGVNKYKNITSAKLVDEIKGIIQAEAGGNLPWLKMGHGGTLDETATGVIAIGIGTGCKFLKHFLSGTKTYIVDGMLGVETDTLNQDGKVVKKMPYDNVSSDSLLVALNNFVGEVLQTPPAYSALKVDGRRFSDLAIAGEEVPVRPRSVRCHSIQLINFSPPFFRLEVTSGGGFYVRSLIRDLGEAVGTCAHVTDLHRKKHGFIRDDLAVSPPYAYDMLFQNARMIKSTRQFKQHMLRYEKPRTAKKSDSDQPDLWIDYT